MNHSAAAAVTALVRNPLVAQEEIVIEVLSDYVQAFGEQMGLERYG